MRQTTSPPGRTLWKIGTPGDIEYWGGDLVFCRKKTIPPRGQRRTHGTRPKECVGGYDMTPVGRLRRLRYVVGRTFGHALCVVATIEQAAAVNGGWCSQAYDIGNQYVERHIAGATG